MKLVLCDYPATLNRGTSYEVDRLKKALPEAEVVVFPYEDDESLYACLADADGCLTAFLPMNEAVFSRSPRLRVVSINASGYNNVDLQAARAHDITVCAVRDYCTEEVAEHTMAILLSLVRKLKVHQYRLEQDKVWAYKLAAPIDRLFGKTLAIFGFGRIGQAVAARAKAFGLHILAVDPYLPKEVAASLDAELVSPAEACQRCDILTNHMNAAENSAPYFDAAFFSSLARQPIFLNMGRGVSVDEAALLQALESGQIRAAGMDVLRLEKPDPATHPLFGRENVVITPHAAFYSEESLRMLQDLSCDNLIYGVTGQTEKIRYIVS